MFRYVPILRYRQEERRAFNDVTFSVKTLPMIELISEKLNTRHKQTVIEKLTEDLQQKEHKIIVDIPTYIIIKRRTKPTVTAYLSPFIANPSSRVAEYKKLPIEKIIPTISYNPNIGTFQHGTLQTQLLNLADFDSVAYRIFIPHFAQAINEVSKIIRQNDIVILDIGKESHSTPFLVGYYAQIRALNNNIKCRTVIIRSALNNITNVGLTNGQPVTSADNSLLTSFLGYGFDGFGDFAGTKKDELLKGGVISPGLIFYSQQGNTYYGYKGSTPQLSEFRSTIVPSLQSTVPWNTLTPTHHANCPGCLKVNNVSIGIHNGENQAMWKGIAISHYLYTLEEFL